MSVHMNANVSIYANANFQDHIQMFCGSHSNANVLFLDIKFVNVDFIYNQTTMHYT